MIYRSWKNVPSIWKTFPIIFESPPPIQSSATLPTRLRQANKLQIYPSQDLKFVRSLGRFEDFKASSLPPSSIVPSSSLFQNPASSSFNPRKAMKLNIMTAKEKKRADTTTSRRLGEGGAVYMVRELEIAREEGKKQTRELKTLSLRILFISRASRAEARRRALRFSTRSDVKFPSHLLCKSIWTRSETFPDLRAIHSRHQSSSTITIFPIWGVSSSSACWVGRSFLST